MTFPMRAFAPLLLLMTLVTLLTGCASFFQDLDDRMNHQKYRSDYDTFNQILRLYDEGDFDVALVQFNALANRTHSPKLTRDAWLGEICCRLILADTQESYATAIDMWNNFAWSAKKRGDALNPTLLDPLIVHMVPQRLATPLDSQLSAAPPPATADDAKSTAGRYRTERQRLKAQIAALKKKTEQFDTLQQQLDEITAENQSLKEKIKALEAIDQIIQKKKTEIAEPSE